MNRTLALLAALALSQLAACASGGHYASQGMMSHEAIAGSYADAIMEGMEKARVKPIFERMPASADRPG